MRAKGLTSKIVRTVGLQVQELDIRTEKRFWKIPTNSFRINQIRFSENAGSWTWRGISEKCRGSDLNPTIRGDITRKPSPFFSFWCDRHRMRSTPFWIFRQPLANQNRQWKNSPFIHNQFNHMAYSLFDIDKEVRKHGALETMNCIFKHKWLLFLAFVCGIISFGIARFEFFLTKNTFSNSSLCVQDARLLIETNRDYLIFYAILFFTFVVGIVGLLDTLAYLPPWRPTKKWLKLLRPSHVLFFLLVAGGIFSVHESFRIYNMSYLLAQGGYLDSAIQFISQHNPTYIDRIIGSGLSEVVEGIIVLTAIVFFALLFQERTRRWKARRLSYSRFQSCCFDRTTANDPIVVNPAWRSLDRSMKTSNSVFSPNSKTPHCDTSPTD